jgi:hypothetical protein
VNTMIAELGNYDIDFLNFRHCQVQNFIVMNLLERNQNFAVFNEGFLSPKLSDLMKFCLVSSHS